MCRRFRIGVSNLHVSNCFGRTGGTVKEVIEEEAASDNNKKMTPLLIIESFDINSSGIKDLIFVTA